MIDEHYRFFLIGHIAKDLQGFNRSPTVRVHFTVSIIGQAQIFILLTGP